MADWVNHLGVSLRRPLQHEWVQPGNTITRAIEASLDPDSAGERVPLQARLPLPEFEPAPPAAIEPEALAVEEALADTEAAAEAGSAPSQAA